MNLKVTAEIISPVAGDIPILDSLLEYQSATLNCFNMHLTRQDPLPEEIPLPVLRRKMNGINIAECSSPIYNTEYEYHEYLNKSIDLKLAPLLSKKNRINIDPGSGAYKSWRLPIRVKIINEIIWFCNGNAKGIKSLLKGIKSVGELRKVGYGRISKWNVQEIDNNYSWYAGDAPVLMRPLPLCHELPAKLTGFRRYFGACKAPYWHPENQMEIVIPC